MSTTIVKRSIAAPVDVVFRAVADVNQFSQALQHIVKVEFLSETKTGLGTRFRETRLLHGKENTTELHVTEFVENDHVRLVADSQGTVWDTVFTVRPADEKTLLTMRMDAHSKSLATRALVFLISGLVRRAIEKDLDAVKAFCESRAA